MSTDCECIVVGAGVVGLAIAAKLASAGREVVILERESSYGSITSARNSEVIHAGIYYPAKSLKAQLCVQGRKLLYDYCEQRHINHKRCGKLIVACDDSQAAELKSIRGRAVLNGVDDLELLGQRDAQKLESALSCVAALHSPSTGIVDSHGLMLSLLGDAQEFGAQLALRAPVQSISQLDDESGYRVEVGGEDGMSLTTQWLVNTAGHGACHLAASIDALSPALIPTPLLTKGNYFGLQTKAPFARLIYPVPEPGGLGVHITIDLAGRARFGPDVQQVFSEDYAVDESRSENFYEAIRRYWPALPDHSLTPDYSGIRPKISFGDDIYTDFMIQSKTDHGLSGLVNLFGIESPGLTACLAIAERVARLLEE